MLLRSLVFGLLLYPTILWGAVAEALLRDLRDNSLQPLAADRPQIVMFFAPDCRWCEKQMQQMVQLQQECQAVRQAVIGINGSRAALKTELRQQRINLAAYSHDAAFVRRLGGIAATPHTLIIDREQHIVTQLRGYISPERLQDITLALAEGQCPAAF